MRLIVPVVALVSALVCIVLAAASHPTCLDEHGKPVDWFVAIKAPTVSGNSLGDGYTYFYADVNSPTLALSSNSLNNSHAGSIALTLQQIYAAHGSSSVGYLMYDDQDPNGTTHSSFGHTKGDLCLDSTSGFWMIHSVPRYPPFVASGYSYPEYAITYGQSFLCMTYKTASFEAIAANMLINKPHIYDSNTPSAVLSSLPTLQAVVAGQWNRTAEAIYRVMVTKGGQPFTVFAKNDVWDNDLYEYLVSPTLQSGLLVESWMDGDGPMPSFCKPTYAWTNENVRTVQMTSSLGWSETKDHSKWAVTTDIPSITCIGDINRQTGQFKRGGGTACLLNSALYKSFTSIVGSHDAC